MTQSGRSRFRRLAGPLFVFVALGFVLRTVVVHWAEVGGYDWRVDWLRLAGSTAGLVVVLAFAVGIWQQVLLRFEGARAEWRDLARIWFLSNLGRYIPGKIWQFVGAAGMARDTGLSPAVVLTSLVVYMGFGLLSGTLIAATVLPLQPVAPLAAAGALALVHPAILTRLLELVPDRLGGAQLRWTGGWLDGVVLLALAALYWLASGLVFYLFVDAVVGVPFYSAGLLIGVNAAAFVVGYLFFIAPAGLGARELVITVLLGAALGGAGVAGAVAILSRIWVVAADLLGAAGVTIVLKGTPEP